MPTIHPTAVVDPDAELGDDVWIGPFCIVEAHTRIGSGTRLLSHVVIKEHTEIGADNEVHTGAVLGGPPQDRKFHGERTFLRIGSKNVIREYVTIHRASGEDLETTVGDDNYIMAYAHFGHNCRVGSHITVASTVGVSGHVTIEDYANLGGMAGVHQKTRIGKAAMIAGATRLTRDAPPFMLTEGQKSETLDINAVGLRRLGVSVDTRMALHKAGKLLFRSNLNMSDAIGRVETDVPSYPEVTYLLDFMREMKNGRHGRALDRA